MKFDNASWQVGDLEPGVYPLTAKNKTWAVNETLKVKARRFGYSLVPDLAGTAHMYQGATLHAAVVHLLAVDHKPRMSDMMAAYVQSSRVRTKETLLIAEPFSPALLCQGPPIGPRILLQMLRGEIAPDAVEAEFDRLEQAHRATGTETNLMKLKWPCMACKLAGCEDYVKKIEDFGVRRAADFRERLLPQGAWARCTHCSRRSHSWAASAGAANTAAQQEQRLAWVQERRLAASRATATCTQCSKEGTQIEFWPADWHNRDQGIACTACQPSAPADRNVGQGHLSEGLLQHIEERRLATLTCRSCSLEKPPSAFWPGDISNRKQNGGLSCTLCKPTPPSRRVTLFTCRTCGAEKTSDRFWHGDIGNRRQNGGLSCTTCEPTAPAERRKRRKRSIDSANP